jgi:hypothetical protein
MAITPILNNNIQAVIDSQINSKYDQVDKVASAIDSVVSLASIMNKTIDFKLLSDVLINLNSVSSANLADLATTDLVSMTEDLTKGNYLGNRKIDIDLSLNMLADNIAIQYQAVNIISSDGISISHPFYATDGVTINETTSPSIILTHIQTAITDYNAGESNTALHILNTEFTLLNEVDVTKPTVIRIRDTDSKSSGILRIELIRYVSGIVDNYFWALTTSALQTLANRVGDIIALGNNITEVSALATRTDEITYLYNDRDKLTGTTNSLYSELTKLQAIYADLISIDGVYADLSVINAVNANKTNIDTVATSKVNIDIVATDITNIDVVATDITNIGTVAADKVNIDSVATSIVPNMAAILQSSTDATNAASSATDAANSATSSANSATTATTEVAKITSLNSAALTLVPGSNSTANYNPGTGTLTLGIPQGAVGPKGENFTVNAVGSTAGKALYDTQIKGFSFLDVALNLIYFKKSNTSGDWSSGAPFGKGDTGGTGAVGNGIASIAFQSTTDGSGLANKSGGTDTYLITYTDATTSVFNVYNGADSAVIDVAGRTGNVVLTSTDVGLGNVDNTSDLNKPVSTAQQTELDLKSDGFLYRAISVNTTAISRDYLKVDTSTAAIIVTLPLTPSENNIIGFLDVVGKFDINALTIGANGNTIMGLSEDMVVDTKNMSLELIYINSDWRIF